MKGLYFMRHALSEDNKQGVFSSVNDCDLAPEGVEQSKQAGQSLKGKSIDLIVSSPLKRARQTAEVIAEQIGLDKSKILLSDLLIERDLGELEGTPYPAPRPTHTYDTVETFSDLMQRASEAYEWIKSLQAENVLVVSHGATGRAMRKVVLPDSDVGQAIGNAEVQKWL